MLSIKRVSVSVTAGMYTQKDTDLRYDTHHVVGYIRASKTESTKVKMRSELGCQLQHIKLHLICELQLSDLISQPQLCSVKRTQSNSS